MLNLMIQFSSTLPSAGQEDLSQAIEFLRRTSFLVSFFMDTRLNCIVCYYMYLKTSCVIFFPTNKPEFTLLHQSLIQSIKTWIMPDILHSTNQNCLHLPTDHQSDLHKQDHTIYHINHTQSNFHPPNTLSCIVDI